MHQRGPWAILVCALGTPLLLAAVGCGERQLTREEFCQDWASAACAPETVSACQESEAKCQSSQTASCRSWLPMDFQDVGVHDCLNAVRSAYSDADLDATELDVVWRLRGPCSGIVVAGEGGAACERDADCSGSFGLTCVLKDQATGTCERAETVEAGFSCEEPNQLCEAGFYCDGEHCIVASDAGDSCKNDSQCAEGHFCQDEQCEEQSPVGADCTTDQECESEICYEVDDHQRVCVDRIRLSPAEPACDGLR